MTEVEPAPLVESQLDVKGLVRLTDAGLEFTRRPTFEEWVRVGVSLMAIGRKWQWWVGDWLNVGEREFGEMHAQAVDAAALLDYDVDTIRRAMWVAGRFPHVRRRTTMSFAHHEAVASLEPADQDVLLDKAEEYGWTSKMLREAVRAYKAELRGAELPRIGPRSAPPPEPAPAPVDDSDDESEIRDELVRALEENRRLSLQIEAMQKTDKDHEILRLNAEIVGLRGRLQQAQREAAEAVKQARWAMGQLDKIRKALGVSDRREILPAIERLVAR